MMTNNTLKSQFNFPAGTTVTGKWHKKRYILVRLLGSGANGIVYLAKSNDRFVALKMSDNTMSVTSEVNVLKAFAKVQGSALGPSLLDIDDWETPKMKIPFYVMEYIQGPHLLDFIQKKGHSWTGVLMLQLLQDLHRLHEEGWVFGDLKPDNLIITHSPTKIRCIDVGGTTLSGRAIKEFTEFFDRGYWGAGTRKAEPSYDLFALSMVIVNLFYPARFSKKGDGVEQLKRMIRKKPEMAIYENILFDAIDGQYYSALDMRRDLLKVLSNDTMKPVKNRNSIPSSRRAKVNKQVRSTRQTSRKKKRASRVFETIVIIVLVSFLYFIYIYEQLL